MPCLLLSKLFVTVKEVVTCEVDLSGVFYCSNSEVALRWIRQQSKNRIADIRHYTYPFHWSHVPSHLITSDISTQSVSLQNFVESSWYNCLSFLLHSVSEWPNKNVCSSHLTEEEKWVSVSLVNNSHSVGKGIGAVVDCEKYTNLGKLLRVTGYVLHFVKKFRLKIKNHELVLGTLTTADINFAQLQWIKFDRLKKMDKVL